MTDQHDARDALLPCPYCGHCTAPKMTDSYAFQDEIGGEFDESNAVYFAVVCDASKPGGPGGCGGMGGFSATKAEAIAAWNRRAATQPTKPEQQAGGVPAGFVLVPAEPTPEMLKAGVTAFQHAYSEADILSDWRACFKAMLSAAPSQSAVQPLSNAQFVKCIETAGFKTWDSRMWSLKREIEASHGIVTKESCT